MRADDQTRDAQSAFRATVAPATASACLDCGIIAAFPGTACPNCGIIAANGDIGAANTLPVCPKCGIIDKSDKASCCGRGGSWFGKCGGDSDPDVEHTWKDGRVACKKAGRYAQVIDLVTDEVQVQEDSLSVMFVSHVCGNILRVDFFVLLFLMSLL